MFQYQHCLPQMAHELPQRKNSVQRRNKKGMDRRQKALQRRKLCNTRACQEAEAEKVTEDSVMNIFKVEMDSKLGIPNPKGIAGVVAT